MNNCEHNTRKSRCLICNKDKLCNHERIKSDCYLCKNPDKQCPHGNAKKYCEDCCQSVSCNHGKERRRCVECGGNSICEHKKRKDNCVECNGCEHGNIKYNCKQCGYGSYCIHEIQKRRCIICDGSGLCEHKRRKDQCKECGTGYCKHKKRKELCKECGGSRICIHNKDKLYCRECGGSRTCQHLTDKRYCKVCCGSRICVHQKYYKYCRMCDGSLLCKNVLCDIVASNTKYDGYCITCFRELYPDEPNVRNYKIKEKNVVNNIIQTYPELNGITDKIIKGGSSKRRPDLLFDIITHIIIVEVDENKHTCYNEVDEYERMKDISKDLQNRPIVFIRFNPDDYINKDGILVKSCWTLDEKYIMSISEDKQKEWEERIESLKQQIQYWIDNSTEKTIEIIELFY